jgi:ankyrin repeat protein
MKYKKRPKELLRSVVSNYLSPSGETLLHFAARDNDVGEILCYLARETPVNYRNDAGETPLYYCAYNDAADAALILLENGADPAIANGLGFTAFVQCVYDKSYRTLEALAPRYNPLQRDAYRLTALHHARLLADDVAVDILTEAMARKGFWWRTLTEPDWNNPNFLEIMNKKTFVERRREIDKQALEEAFK